MKKIWLMSLLCIMVLATLFTACSSSEQHNADESKVQTDAANIRACYADVITQYLTSEEPETVVESESTFTAETDGSALNDKDDNLLPENGPDSILMDVGEVYHIVYYADTESWDIKKASEQSSDSSEGQASKETFEADYANIELFEAALNEGNDVTGKAVTFTIDKINPDSAFGHNLMAGEHVNFCSDNDPGFSVGDTVTVKALKVESVLGSWIIYYETV